MESVLTFILLFVSGYCGYKIFSLLHFPAAGLVGAMFTVATLSILGVPWAPLPLALSLALQAMIGIMVGSKFAPETVGALKSLALPSALVAGWMVVTGIVSGFILSQVTALDLGTAILSSAPGGMAEMSVLAFEYGVDVPTVALLQFFRILGTYLAVPLISTHLVKGHGIVLDTREEGVTVEAEVSGLDFSLLRSLVVGGLGGYLGWRLRVPAGGIMGAMALMGYLRARGYNLVPLPRRGILLTQIGLGGMLGLTFDPSLLGHLQDMLIPVLLLTLIILGSGTFLALVVHRMFHWDIPTCLLACAAAGLSQMSIIAGDMDADPVKVALLHLVRIIAIIIMLPPLFHILV